MTQYSIKKVKKDERIELNVKCPKCKEEYTYKPNPKTKPKRKYCKKCKSHFTVKLAEQLKNNQNKSIFSNPSVNKVLNVLTNSDISLSQQQICEKTKISRSTVSKSLKILRDKNYVIELKGRINFYEISEIYEKLHKEEIMEERFEENVNWVNIHGLQIKLPIIKHSKTIVFDKITPMGKKANGDPAWIKGFFTDNDLTFERTNRHIIFHLQSIGWNYEDAIESAIRRANGIRKYLEYTHGYKLDPPYSSHNKFDLFGIRNKKEVLESMQKELEEQLWLCKTSHKGVWETDNKRFMENLRVIAPQMKVLQEENEQQNRRIEELQNKSPPNQFLEALESLKQNQILIVNTLNQFIQSNNAILNKLGIEQKIDTQKLKDEIKGDNEQIYM